MKKGSAMMSAMIGKPIIGEKGKMGKMKEGEAKKTIIGKKSATLDPKKKAEMTSSIKSKMKY